MRCGPLARIRARLGHRADTLGRTLVGDRLRAINGRIEQVYHQGELVGERRVPNDRLLTWLLARLDPRRFALPWEQRGDADPQAEASNGFAAMLAALDDVPS